MTAREWLRFDVGLLDDERFAELPTIERGVWLTIYLLLGREGDSVKSLDRLRFLLRRQGVADLVTDLEEKGWFVPHSAGGITLRGYEARQVKWHRGPSDMPDQKAARNSKRPTTRAGRRGASVEQRGATPPDPPVRDSIVSRSEDTLAPRHPQEDGPKNPPKSLKDIIGPFEDVVSGKSGSTS
jgi:hypothetical protein